MNSEFHLLAADALNNFTWHGVARPSTERHRLDGLLAYRAGLFHVGYRMVAYDQYATTDGTDDSAHGPTDPDFNPTRKRRRGRQTMSWSITLSSAP